MTIYYNNSAVEPVTEFSENFLDIVADTLYCRHEMYPTSREWRNIALARGAFLADYHGTEFALVCIDWERDIVNIVDTPVEFALRLQSLEACF